MEKKNVVANVYVIAIVAACLLLTDGINAQVQTQTNTTKEHPPIQTSVERGEVVYVSGNDLVVKMEDGTIRHIANVPESARISVDGKELGIHDLKPGMKLERTITTITTPKMITTVQSVKGKVWHVNPPASVILTLEDGTNQQFKIPKGQKFNVEGQMVDAWGLKKGMNVSATKIVEEPITEIEKQRKVTGSMPPPPPAPPADMPLLVAVAAPTPAPTVAETPATPEKLPKTGSELPLLGLVGFLSLAGGLGLKLFRHM